MTRPERLTVKQRTGPTMTTDKENKLISMLVDAREVVRCLQIELRLEREIEALESLSAKLGAAEDAGEAIRSVMSAR